MAPRDRGQTENKGSDDPGSSKSPCLSWGNLTCLYDSYTGINGRRKLSVFCRIRKKAFVTIFVIQHFNSYLIILKRFILLEFILKLKDN